MVFGRKSRSNAVMGQLKFTHLCISCVLMLMGIAELTLVKPEILIHYVKTPPLRTRRDTAVFRYLVQRPDGINLCKMNDCFIHCQVLLLWHTFLGFEFCFHFRIWWWCCVICGSGGWWNFEALSSSQHCAEELICKHGTQILHQCFDAKWWSKFINIFLVYRYVYKMYTSKFPNTTRHLYSQSDSCRVQ